MKRHRWIAISSYQVSEDALLANLNDPAGRPLVLDHENLVYIGVGCYDCEEPFTPAVGHARCSAPAADLERDHKWTVTSLGYQERLDAPTGTDDR